MEHMKTKKGVTMITSKEVYMFTLICELQIQKHRYDKKNNYVYYFDNDGAYKICKLEKQKANIVSAYILEL
tara:strand:- start:87 stop:299 length:213 start_codon:yes stop_codon:yes gene_type:complete